MLVVTTVLSCFVASSALDLLDCSTETGHNVTMTFYFSEDISKDHEITGFSVLQNHHLDDIEPVVECIWFPPRNLRCLETPGYELIKPITETVRIVIKNYSDERHGGLYSCQTSPGQQLISKKCKLPLHLKDKQTEFSTQTPDIHETTGHHESEQHERCDDTSKYVYIVAISSLISALSTVFLMVFFVTKRRQQVPVYCAKQCCGHRCGDTLQDFNSKPALRNCSQNVRRNPSRHQYDGQLKAPMCCGFLSGAFQYFRSSTPSDYCFQQESLNPSCHQNLEYTEELQPVCSVIHLGEQTNRKDRRYREDETSSQISLKAVNEPKQETTRSSAHTRFSSDKADDAEEAGGLRLLAEKANVHNKGHRADDSSSRNSVYTDAPRHFNDKDRSS